MDKKQRKKHSLLFWFVFLLTVSVIATSILTIMLMDKYYFDAADAIDIGLQQEQTYPNQPSDADGQLNTGDGPQQSADAQSGHTGGTKTKVEQVATVVEKKFGFRTSDAQGTWVTDTTVDIFKSSYTNANGDIIAQSHNGDKIIAPGTSNDFTFKISNTGEIPLDFVVDIGTIVTEGHEVPLNIRLQRYDGKWIIGDEDTWVKASEQESVQDTGTISEGRYFYYTLEWQWPFDVDEIHDLQDMQLAEVSVDSDIEMIMEIVTLAKISSTYQEEVIYSGITIPNTGDTGSIVIWGTVAVCSLVITLASLVFIILVRRREEEEEEENENSVVEDTQI